jgi:hypothetical protein
VLIDTSAAGFTTVPTYVVSVGGKGHHWGIAGSSSIYNPTAKGFEVEIRWEKGYHQDGTAVTPAVANQNQWHIHWIGIEHSSGSGQAISTPSSSANKVAIFPDNNFGGTGQEIGVGSYDIKDLTIGNDKLSSLKVPAGYKVTLFSDGGFQGKSKTFTSDATSVGDFNDITSSIKVERLLDPQKWYYLIVKHTGKVLNIAGASTDNGGNAIQYQKSVSDNSLWRFEDAGDGYYYIIAKHSGRALQVNGGNKEDGGNVNQWTKENADHHKWRLEHADNGYFYLIAKHSGKALQVHGGSKEDSVNVNQWTKQNVDHHKWTFEAV